MIRPCGLGPGVPPEAPGPGPRPDGADGQAHAGFVAQVQPIVDAHVAALVGVDGAWCAHLGQVPGQPAFAFARLLGTIACLTCLGLLREIAGEAERCDTCGALATPDRPLWTVAVLAGPTLIHVERCPGCQVGP